jgi:Cu/Ag efflux protein CusF
MTKLLVFIAVAAFAGFAWVLLPSPDEAQAPGATLQTATGSGLVVGIDTDKGVVTVSHGPLPALNMMAMTMGFPVKDRNQLSYDGKDYVITAIK